jgi:hypothetical protein
MFTNSFLFVCLVKRADGNIYCGFSDGRLESSSIFSSPSTRIACLTAEQLEIFLCPTSLLNGRNKGGIPFVLSFFRFISTTFSFSSTGMSIKLDSYPDVVVIYEIIRFPNCNSCPLVIANPSVDEPILSVVPPAAILTCSNLSIVPPPLQQLLQSVTAALNQVIQCNSKFEKLGENMSRYQVRLYEELYFMMYFLYNQLSSIIIRFPKPIETALTLLELEQSLQYHEVIPMIIMRLLEMFKLISSLTNITSKASDTAVRRRIDPIAYFNVEGKRIAILKDLIRETIPESQLSIRVCSGRWEEQEKDLDEDGNINLDGSKEVLSKIFTAIRSARLFGKETRMAVPVSKQLETELKTVVDYLQIDSSLLSFSFVA